MAYVHSGTAFSLKTTIYTDTSSPFSKVVRHEDAIIKANNNYAICFVYLRNINGVKLYQFRSFKIGASSYTDEFKGTKTLVIDTEETYKNGKVNKNQTTESLPENAQPITARIGQDSDSTWIFSTAIPVFNSEVDFNSYFTSGDTSSSVTFVNTDWILFIDGSQNPLYKLTWNCQGINNKNVSNSFVKLWVGKYDSFLGTVTDISPFKEVAYSEGKCKFSFADISKLVKQPTIGHNPACLLMQLGYREFVTARIETSTKMGVDLYFDKSSIQTMYDNLGYFTTEDGVIKKTSSGDGSTLTVKYGKEGSDGYTSDDDGGYDDGKDNDDADGESADISAGIGVLTTTFKMTKERLQQLGQFLWGSSIFDKFSLVNNNPIENIVSCKAIPLEKSGTNQQIVLGNVETGVNGEKISNNFGKTTIGSVTVAEYYKNFLDYSPYTNVIIYLPYIGFRELDTSMIMGKTVKVDYTTDCITGGCLAQISVGGVRLYEFTGIMGIDIPITASNRAQVEAGYIQAGVGAAMSLAGGNIAGATTALINSATAQYHYSSTGNPSPMCVASTNRTCYIVIDRPQFQKVKAFNHTRGQKCNLSKTIGSLKGFTICDSNIDLSGISATETEKEEIVNILSTGFFA